MGGGSWSPATYTNYATTKGLIDHTGASTKLDLHQVFDAHTVNQALNPHGLKVRESCDSDEHPTSNAIMLWLDVTGSMGVIAQYIAQQALGKLMKEVYERLPVPHPQIAFGAVDDIECSGHVQISQFESDIRIAEQLQQMWIEGKGGGNHYESYTMAWLIAAMHTRIDCYDKRGKKGYLFTMGDEEVTPYLNPHDVERVLGYKPQVDLDAKSLLKLAQKKYNVFHIIVDEGSHARSDPYGVDKSWKDVLGASHVIHLKNWQKLAEVVVSTIQLSEGASPDDVVKSWDEETAKIVQVATAEVKRVIEL